MEHPGLEPTPYGMLMLQMAALPAPPQRQPLTHTSNGTSTLCGAWVLCVRSLTCLEDRAGYKTKGLCRPDVLREIERQHLCGFLELCYESKVLRPNRLGKQGCSGKDWEFTCRRVPRGHALYLVCIRSIPLHPHAPSLGRGLWLFEFWDLLGGCTYMVSFLFGVSG